MKHPFTFKNNTGHPAIMTLLFIYILLSIIGCQHKRLYSETVVRLKTIDLKTVQAVNIYPRVTNPIGKPIIFINQDSLVNDFFQSVNDIDVYFPSHDRVFSRNYSWFMEIITDNDTIQIQFRIPFEKGSIIAGRIGKYEQKGATFYGWFQSRQLYQWYQKYKDRWLNPGKLQLPEHAEDGDV